MDAEFWASTCPPSWAARSSPPSLRWALAELILGANPAVGMFAPASPSPSCSTSLGTDEQKKLAKLMVDQQWGATMVLTEPDAGSDVGAGRTKAVQQPDGTWHITGVKRFITSAEHDLSDNIVHFVLRPAPRAPAPGTKGLSLFVVPKFHCRPRDRRARRAQRRRRHQRRAQDGPQGLDDLRDDLRRARHPGRRHPARRRPRGHRPDVPRHRVRPDDGRHQGDRDALDRLPQRARLRQAARPGRRPDPAGRQGRAARHHHPPPRRPPLADAAEVVRRGPAGAGALHRDPAGHRRPARWPPAPRSCRGLAGRAGQPGQRPAAADRQGRSAPSGRGCCSAPSRCRRSAAPGFLQDYPIEQYVRDAKIDTLYEGTTAIQGLDFFFRKIVKDQGAALGHVAMQIQEFAKDRRRRRRARQGARAARARRSSDVQGILGYESASRSSPTRGRAATSATSTRSA